MRSFVAPLLASLAALVVGGVALVAAGVDPAAAFRSFARGAFATRHGMGESLVTATPLLLSGLSVALSFRAGLFNIGAEGQLLAGMLCATAIGTAESPAALLALPASALGGAAVGLLAAWLTLRRGVPEVLATLLLNFVLLHAVGVAVHGFLQEAARTYPQSDPIALAARLPRWLDGTRVHVGVLVALAAAVLLHHLAERSVIGLRWRAAGAAPAAARLAGFPVRRDLLAAFVLSGLLAGLAGGIEVTGVTGRLYESPSGGVGYAAIAVALLGRLRPASIVLAALLFGALDAGCAAMERDVGVSHGLGRALEGVAIAVFLALEAGPIRERLRRRSAGAEAT
ncbi:MAG: ABC transporter permease [Planctomycetota bacterium JB042]